MTSRAFRLGPVVAAVSAGLLLAGAAGAAVAAPPEDSPSASSSASGESENEPVKGHWDKHGPYSDESSCRRAGEEGKRHGDWHSYQCRREYEQSSYRYAWWLYTH
ncbi:hypothetical protein ACFP1Z_19780 [Streptomyces gamaensis]|uniref:Secreted protein n=1 Tax=Streptomyces gamaensis TaxID=1763542 RepID=A0ABW0Z138_9ACTN